jgi:hypothetical protein
MIKMFWKRKYIIAKMIEIKANTLFRILKHEVKDTGNVKRESKNYSYKEQMAARELEKELAAKQNKTETTQLTKKQQDMLQQQLDQEQTIRDNIKKVKLKFILLFSKFVFSSDR